MWAWGRLEMPDASFAHADVAPVVRAVFDTIPVARVWL